ncbi:MAG: hypothetical protein BWK80_13015 [Desulfobacteraceae bacterium IS3]|nr:MAG: hypothetical protein BWK80_13015 [Desulfobacteraceae bacterium IS3]
MIEKAMVKEGVAAGAGKSVPAAVAGKSAAAGGTLGATVKATMLSPIFGLVVLGGIIVWELWKGSKDAKEFKAV